MSAVPSALGPYRLERPLGQGGMGEVYEAWDARLERHVAVKRLRSEVDRGRLLAEARATARLDHPSIVRVHDVLEHPTGDWLVMEKVDGEPLSERLRRQGPLAVDVVRELTRQLAAGLECAHSRGVVHRDLKTENVLVDGDGRAKIIDFGIALTASSGTDPASASPRLTAEGRVVGTARAMSPEQALGRPLDPRSDLFSLGVLLYESLTGASPFQGKDADDTVLRICTHRPPAPAELRPEVPEDFSGLVLQLLEKDPSCRPSDSGEVLKRLDAVFPEPQAPTDSGTLPRRRAVADGLDAPALDAESLTGAGPERFGTVGATLVLALLAVAITSLVVVWLGSRSDAHRSSSASPAAEQPLRVAVLPSMDTSESEAQEGAVSDLVPVGLDAALERALLDRPGLILVSSAIDQPLPSATTDAARLLGADVLVQARLRCAAVECRVRLQRLRGDDGAVESMTDFSLPPLKAGLAYGLADAYLDTLFPSSTADGTSKRIVSADDWQSYLELHRQFESGAWGGREAELAEILARHRNRVPSWVEIYLFEAELLASPALAAPPERVRDLLATASTVAPDDPRPRREALRHALDRQDWDAAEDLLETLERDRPGDPDLPAHHATLAAGRGRVDEAVALQRRAAELRPTWINLYRLARLEHRAGNVDDARRTLDHLLRDAPDHLAGAWLQAQLELLHGSPAQAAELYGRLAERWPRAVGNQGLAELLAGNALAAAELLHAALQLAPDHPPTRLNLADALWIQGDTEAATKIYESLAEGTERPFGEPWQRRALEAQALAHLGRRVDAATALGQALALAPDEPQLAYEAALVYAVLGEDEAARREAQRATDGGVSPVWFRLPWFDTLRDEPTYAGNGRQDRPDGSK